MIPLALEGLLIRTDHPEAVVTRYLARGAVSVAPLADFGWFSGARMSVDGLALSIARFGPPDGRNECSIMFSTTGGAPGLRQRARDLDLKASAAIHSAVADANGFPVAWWTVLLFGLLDGETRLPRIQAGSLQACRRRFLERMCFAALLVHVRADRRSCCAVSIRAPFHHHPGRGSGSRRAPANRGGGALPTTCMRQVIRQAASFS